MQNKLISVLLVVTLIFSLVGCEKTSQTTADKPQELKVVKLGFPGSANFMGSIAGIAQEKKFIDEELQKIGYKVEYVPFAAAGPAVNEALATQKIDLAIYADFPGLVLKSKDIGISLLAVADNYLNATLLVKQDSPYESVKDLKDKKIAFAKGTFMHKYFLEVLEQNGLSEKDVQVVNVVTTDAASALLSGNVDALIYVDSLIVSILADKSAREIDSTRRHPELRAQQIFVGVDAYVQENADVPVAIITALAKANEFVKNNPQEAVRIWTKSGLKEEAVKILYGTDGVQYAQYFPIEIKPESLAKLTATKNFLLKQGLISKDYEIEKFADHFYYKKALN